MTPARPGGVREPARVLVAGGGSGGHAIPALAIAEALERRLSDTTFLFIGTARGVESRVVPKAGFPLSLISVISLKRSLHPDLIRFPFVLLKGFIQSIRRVRAFAPHVVVCTGGFVSGPVGLAAAMLGFPLVVHEQNLLPGVTLRVLSRAALLTFAAFPGALPRIGGRRKQAVGCPMRQPPERAPAQSARRAFDLDPNRQTLLILGGSQGARGINEAVAEALPDLMARDLQLVWQTGVLDHGRMCRAAEGLEDRVKVFAFIDDMSSAYGAADLAVTRAGAMSIAEMNLFGLPAILVPLPWASENHQEINARSMERAGWARVMLQRDLTGEGLATEVGALLDNAELRERMSRSSRQMAVADAADRIAEDLVQFLGDRRDPLRLQVEP